MTRPLITGGTGFLGRHVVRLLAPDARVLVRRESRGLARLGVEQVTGDVEDAASLAHAMRGATGVYHLAGLVSRSSADTTRMMRVHVDGTRAVLEAAAAAGVKRVVIASSSGTIAVSRDAAFVADERAPHALEVVKGWPYYLSKIYQERLALELGARLGLEIVLVLPSLLLGPGDARGSSTEDVKKLMQQKIPLVPDGGVNFVDARDAAAAFVAAMERGRPGERYLVGGPNWTCETFFGKVARAARVTPPRLRVPAKWARWGATLIEEVALWRGVVPAVDRVSVEMAEHFWYVDSGKAERELGFVARDPHETLADTVRYVEKHFLGKERPGPSDGAPPAW